MEFNKQELAKYFGTTLTTIENTFPTFKSRMLAKGFLITKRGKGATAIYEVEKVEPQKVDPQEFSTRKVVKCIEDLDGEIWVNVYQHPGFEVSNYGRFRNKETKVLHQCTKTSSGYIRVSIKNQNYALHRIVLSSFNPIENLDEWTVDHIDGNRSNNKLSNLRWVSPEENTQLMILHRDKLNQQLTKLLQKYSYDELLEKLQQL